jgi:hypothetical protein
MRSSVQSGPYQYDNPRRSAVEIVGVNGHLYRGSIVYLEPGSHTILAEISPASPWRRALPMAVTLNVRPCTAYYLAAEAPTTVTERWAIVLDRVVPIEGCKSKSQAIAPGDPR